MSDPSPSAEAASGSDGGAQDASIPPPPPRREAEPPATDGQEAAGSASGATAPTVGSGSGNAQPSAPARPSEPTPAASAERLTGAAPRETLSSIGVSAPKLFVGQIPREMDEASARAMFAPYGKIFDFSLLVSRGSGVSKGSAFLTYFDKESADAAIAALHEKVTLPGMHLPLCVKIADGHKPSQAKLFLGMVPFAATEDDLRPHFEAFGKVEDVIILRHQDSGNSKGCGFVRYKDMNSCAKAIEALNGKLLLQGAPGPMTVKMADNDKQKNARKLQKLGFGGPVMGMAPVGMMPMMGMAGPMMGMARGMPRGMPMHHNPMMAMGYGRGMPPGPPPGYGYPTPAFRGYGGPALPAGVFQGPQGVGVAPNRNGPETANVFVFNIPGEARDYDLFMAFSSFGTIFSAKVFVDKVTQQSKRFGFVSFASPQQAAQAIHSMHGYVWNGQRLKVSLKQARGRAAPY